MSMYKRLVAFAVVTAACAALTPLAGAKHTPGLCPAWSDDGPVTAQSIKAYLAGWKKLNPGATHLGWNVNLQPFHKRGRLEIVYVKSDGPHYTFLPIVNECPLRDG
jgi:hypothetical protein